MEVYSEIPYLNKATNKWEIVILDEKGKHVRNQECESKEQAETLIDQNNKEVQKTLNDKANKTKLLNEKSTLESMISSQENKDLDNVNTLPAQEIDAEMEKKLEEFKEQFEKDENEVAEQAKDLLKSIAKLYFDKRIIDKNEYLKHKMEIEAKGVASTLFQLKTARLAIYKLTEEIYVGNTSPRMFEVLTGLQRIVLDISKFQHDHLTSLEESFKNTRADIALNEEINPEGGDNNGQGQITDGTVVEKEGGNTILISTNSRKNLLIELNGIIADSKDKTKVPKSRNTRLHDDDENVTDVEHTTYEDEKESGDKGEENNTGGLSTFKEDDSDEDI